MKHCEPYRESYAMYVQMHDDDYRLTNWNDNFLLNNFPLN